MCGMKANTSAKTAEIHNRELTNRYAHGTAVAVVTR